MLHRDYTGCVYLATNTTNGRCYVGKTIMPLCDRKAIHCHAARRRASKSAFHAAIRKYGIDVFQWEKLFECSDEALLFDAERSLIVDYRSAGARLYNIGDGGEGQSVPCSDARRISAREAARNRIVTPETRRKLSEIQKGRKKPPEQVAKMRLTKTGAKVAPWSAERRAKFTATWAAKTAAGYCHTPETKAAQSAAGKRRLARAEERERLSDIGNKGRAVRWGS